ncbi:hypothetical protein PHYC_02694 [Phycisphaerales bacterium]|nr:hypothetical protein PHYC_02694 [Phycisphaerales bacterium]
MVAIDKAATFASTPNDPQPGSTRMCLRQKQSLRVTVHPI